MPIRLCFLLLMIPALTCAQSSRKSMIVASAAAFALGKNEVEVNTYGTFSYDFRAFNFGGAPYRYYPQRFHSISGGLQVTYGVSESKRLNIGLDVNPVSTFEAGNAENGAGYAQIGPRIRWQPLGLLREGLDITIQNSALFTVGDQSAQFSKDLRFRNQVIASQFFHIPNLKLDFILQGLMEVDVQPRTTAPGLDRKRPLVMPVSLLLGLMPNEDWVIFGAVSHATEWGTIPWAPSADYFTRRKASSLSGGVQYLIARKHALFFSHSFLLNQTFGGGANAFSMGLRLLFLEQY